MASSGSTRPENIRDYEGDSTKAYPNNLDCVFEIEVSSYRQLGQYIELSVYYDVEEGHDFIWLETGNGEVYYVLTGSHQDGEADRFYIPVESRQPYAMRLRFVTDSRGRRGGFFAEARRAGAETIEINLDASGGADGFDQVILGPATQTVPAWVDEVAKRAHAAF